MAIVVQVCQDSQDIVGQVASQVIQVSQVIQATQQWVCLVFLVTMELGQQEIVASLDIQDTQVTLGTQDTVDLVYLGSVDTHQPQGSVGIVAHLVIVVTRLLLAFQDIVESVVSLVILVQVDLVAILELVDTQAIQV